MTPPPNLRHQVLVGRLHLAFQLALRDRSQVVIVEAYRLEATGGTYRLAETCRPGSTATTPLLPGLALDVAALFAE